MADGGTLPAGLPPGLPSIADAKLPAAYQAAKSALAVAAGLDECREWANRMEAIASYARQADDDALLNHAMRIKARAVQRCGELLKEIPPAPVGRPSENREGAQPIFRSEAVVRANLSPHQAKQAIAVANVPRDQFEAQVEAANPPTVSELAEIGRRYRESKPVEVDYLKGRNPDDFQKATKLIGTVRRLGEDLIAVDLRAARRGLSDCERTDVIAIIDRLVDCLGKIKDELLDGV